MLLKLNSPVSFNFLMWPFKKILNHVVFLLTSTSLRAGAENFFSKSPDSKYFRLFGTYGLCPTF